MSEDTGAVPAGAGPAPEGADTGATLTGAGPAPEGADTGAVPAGARPDPEGADTGAALAGAGPAPEGTDSGAALAGLATVTVTFHPDLPALERQLRALPEACAKLVVDNTAEPETGRALSELLARVPRARLLGQDHNAGLAAGLNRGVALAHSLGAQWVLLLDQDSVPAPGAVRRLLEAWLSLRARGEPVGAVGPRLRDPRSGVEHGFHVRVRGFWQRLYPAPGASRPVLVHNLNGSGLLMATQAFLELGGMDESLFIDHVDTDWAFRLQAAGRRLYGIAEACFEHRMGESTSRLWLLGWRAWPHRSPQRHYYLFRNALRLMRRPYVPASWKFWAALRLTFTLLLHLGLDRERAAQGRCMLRGLREGLTGAR